jgi:hypothetical protein
MANHQRLLKRWRLWEMQLAAANGGACGSAKYSPQTRCYCQAGDAVQLEVGVVTVTDPWKKAELQGDPADLNLTGSRDKKHRTVCAESL